MLKIIFKYIYNTEGKTRKRAVEVLAVIFIVGIISFTLYNHLGDDGPQVSSKRVFMMDTTFEIVLYSTDEGQGNRLIDEAFNEARNLEKVLSRFISSSDVDRINRNAGIEPVEVDPVTFHVVEKAIHFSEISEGSFDVTVAPLLELWGFGTGEHSVPTEEEIKEVLPLVDYKKIEIEEDNLTVFLQEEGMAIDLGGIAKGYIVDHTIEYLERQGAESAFVDAGDIRVLGERPDETPWKIGVRHPRQREDLIAVIPVSDESIDTSGDYERFFIEDGKRYHHIIDPHTGKPTREMLSVTVVSPDCVAADTLSTAAFVLGPEKGLELLEELPEVEGLLFDVNEELYITSGLKDIMK